MDHTLETNQQDQPLKGLLLIDDPAEVRVLGCLMEKEMSTPAYYPMTLNGITAACNQKNNRDPVVEYDETIVHGAVERLRKKALVSTVTGTGIRVQKYKHNAAQVYSLSHPEAAVICLLLLRGPQTPGELRSRSGSMHPFTDLVQLDTVLQALGDRPAPLVRRLPRAAGQKEARFTHLISGEPAAAALAEGPTDPAATTTDRIAALEDRTAALQDRIAELEQQFAQFKKQFE